MFMLGGWVVLRTGGGGEARLVAVAGGVAAGEAQTMQAALP